MLSDALVDSMFDPTVELRKLFARDGKSIDILDCPAYWGDNCHCRDKCLICNHGRHVAYHGPLYGKPVGSPPWGHQFYSSDEPLPKETKKILHELGR